MSLKTLVRKNGARRHGSTKSSERKPADLGKKTVDWIQVARDLSVEFEKTVVERDRKNQRPFAELKKLRASGLVNLLIPAKFGGEGGTIREAAHVVLELSKGDGSLGALLAFHYYNSQIARYLDYEGDAEALQRESAKKRWFWGNATQYVNKDFVAEEHPKGGYVVSGTKLWNTGAPVADVTTVLAIHPNRQQFIYFYIPTSRKGLKFHNDWDQLGLRGADSGSITFDNVRIYPDEILPWTHAGVQTGPVPFWTTFGGVFYSAVNLGSSLAVLDHAKKYSQTQRRQSLYPPGVDSATNDPLIQTQYGELFLKVQAGLAFFEQVIAELQHGWDNRAKLSDEDRGNLSLRTLSLRAYTATVALEVTPKIYEFGGGRATGSAYGFDRFWRNVRQLSVHDPLIYSIRNLGDHALNEKPFKYPNIFEHRARLQPPPPGKPIHDPTLPLNANPYLKTLHKNGK
jgi:alkylation response protein AidB-like acyl-CoA dehydrogenase